MYMHVLVHTCTYGAIIGKGLGGGAWYMVVVKKPDFSWILDIHVHT